jgi:serine/threonine protein kinase
VTFVDLIVDQAGLMLVMELLPLGNLKHQHREKRFSRAELKAILRQVLDAVAYLHGQSRVHRDLKPENILLRTRDPPFAKISDFGLATPDGFLKTQCGTKKYAAPEIFKGTYGKPVDIWSLGASWLDIAEGLPDESDEPNHEDWATEVQRRVTKACNKRADPFLGLLKEMLDIKPTARPSAEKCLKDPRLNTSPRDDQFDLTQGRDVGRDLVTAILGPPTEIISDPEDPPGQPRKRARTGETNLKLGEVIEEASLSPTPKKSSLIL